LPRFHFHIMDGTDLFDRDGLQLPDVAAAKLEAIRLAGAVLSESRAGSIWQDQPWQMIVNDDPTPNTGLAHFTLTLTVRGSEAPTAT